MKNYKSYLIIFLVLIIGVLAAFRGLMPEKPQAVSAVPELFSSGRAMEKLKVIAQAPHPTGFSSNRIIKDYLVAELIQAGLDPVVIPANVERNDNIYYIENIIAIKRGTGGKDAGKILLSAHYDARGEAPGAGDNGYAVAAVLETLRALKAFPPMKNDLVIIFPDGEELGSLGAKAFISENPLADSIDFVLNFDGRGSSGASLMFETSPLNLSLIHEFNKAKGSSFSNSLSDEIYRLIPNYTDFTWYLKKAPQGLNFAHISSVENYHNATDDIAHLDEGTVQSHGNSMLACVKHFGNISLKEKQNHEAVYFHLLFPGLIIYPASFALPLAIFAALFFILIFITGRRQDKLSITGMLKASGIFLLRIVVAGVAIHFTWKLIGPMMAGFGKYELDWVPNGDYIGAGFLSASLVIFLLFGKKMIMKCGQLNSVMGTLFIWLLLAIATSVYFRGGSYLFLWPLVFSMIPVLVILLRNKPLKPGRIVFLSMIFALPGIFLFSQVLYLFYETMTLRMAGAIAAMFVIMLSLIQLAIVRIEE